MIWPKIIWGLVLAALLGINFRRAWKWEHGAEPLALFGESKNGKETFVFVPPTILFWILLIFFVMYVIAEGPEEGFIMFIALLADMMLIMCVYFALLLVFLPLLRKKISARACAVLWLIPAFLSWQSHVLIRSLPLPKETVYIPRKTLLIIGLIWAAGFIAVGAYYIITNTVFAVRIRKSSKKEQDAVVLAVFKGVQEALDYHHPVKVLRADVKSPFSMGLTRLNRCTVLPDKSYSKEELELIFSHELHHLQRCDVDTKVFLCMCNAFCWFNPLVWIATKKAAEDLELSCDEIVTEGMEESRRRAYSDLILSSAAPSRGCTTCLSSAAGTLRYRLKGIMKQKKRLLGTGLLMTAIFICVMCFGLVSVSDAKGTAADLFLANTAEISHIYDNEYKTVSWNYEKVRNALEGIKTERLAGLRAPIKDSDEITIFYSDGSFICIAENVVTVHDLHNSRKTEYYVVKSGVNLDALISSFN